MTEVVIDPIEHRLLVAAYDYARLIKAIWKVDDANPMVDLEEALNTEYRTDTKPQGVWCNFWLLAGVPEKYIECDSLIGAMADYCDDKITFDDLLEAAKQAKTWKGEPNEETST